MRWRATASNWADGRPDSRRPRMVSVRSAFPEAQCAYDSLFRDRDGTLVYALSSHSATADARLFRLAPGHDVPSPLPPLGPSVRHEGCREIAHAKVHVPPVRIGDLLCFATHAGYYENTGGVTTVGRSPGLDPYPGGLMLSYREGESDYGVLGQAPPGQGIIAMEADIARGRLWGLTWPGGLLLRCDVGQRRLEVLGPVLAGAETVSYASPRHNPVCRRLAVDPADGAVYWTDKRGDVHVFRPESGRAATLEGCSLATAAGGRAVGDPNWGYQWRTLVRRHRDGAFYGLIGTVPKLLFRFDPAARELSAVSELGCTPGERARLRHRWVTLAFRLAPDDDTLFYVGLHRQHSLRGLRAATAARIVTHDLSSGRQHVLAWPRLPGGGTITQCEALAVGPERLFALATISRGFGPWRRIEVDLIDAPRPDL